MKTAFRSSFARDLKKIRDRSVLRQVQDTIEEVEGAAHVQAIGKLRKMSGGGNIEADEVEFVRCLHRRDIYSLESPALLFHRTVHAMKTGGFSTIGRQDGGTRVF